MPACVNRDARDDHPILHVSVVFLPKGVPVANAAEAEDHIIGKPNSSAARKPRTFCRTQNTPPRLVHHFCINISHATAETANEW
jgi:hypothetical protein